MIGRRVARRYVNGFIQVAHERGLLDQCEAALVQLDAGIRDNREFAAVLYHPAIPRDRKKDILRSVLGDQAPDILKCFLDYIVDKKRERILGLVCAEYIRAADAQRGIVRVTVRSAVALGSGQEEALRNALEKGLAKKVVIDSEPDRYLVGGMQVLVGSYILDGTVAGRLNLLRRHLQAQAG